MSIDDRKPVREPLSRIVLERLLEIHESHVFGPACKEALAMVELTREALRRLDHKRARVAQN